MEKEGREKFGTRLGFILVSAGCAVGLGNVWKFPYICGKNGGAAFILLYLACLVMLGLPILIFEFTIGRGSGRSICSAFKILTPENKRWNKFSVFCLAGNYLLMMFYTMVAGWMVNYIVVMAKGSHWSGGTEAVSKQFGDMIGSPTQMIGFTFLVIALCIGVCALGLKNGVEKVSKYMMSALIVLMLVMAVHSLLLKNSMEGLKFYLLPDFEKMKAQGIGNVLFDAMTHSFFTLSVGIGSMEIFGSYLSKDRSIPGEALHVTVLDTLIALIAGIIIIPACFAYGVEPDAGPSLLFVTLPNVFHHMPYGQVWGTCFFVFMSFAALSTVIAVFENIIAMCMEQFNISRKKAVCINLFGITIASLPAILGFNVWSGFQPLGSGTNVMDLEDFIVSYNILPLGSLLMVLFCNKLNGWGFEKFLAETDAGSGMKFPRKLHGYCKYVLPLIILAVYFKGYYDFFEKRAMVVRCFWMAVAVLFVSFILYCAFGSNKSKTEDEDDDDAKIVLTNE
ncbi:MAG: sodium-dependent transporter [Lachnospiraceae bacterium]|nr:sodium-dependent transporter [Lachnospiraceae bacterium]